MQVRIRKIDGAELLGPKCVHSMRVTNDGHTDLYIREESKSGAIKWSIYNKGMYDEQSDANASRLEKRFQANLQES